MFDHGAYVGEGDLGRDVVASVIQGSDLVMFDGLHPLSIHIS